MKLNDFIMRPALNRMAKPDDQMKKKVVDTQD